MEKNARPAGARCIVQGSLQSPLAIALAHPPKGGSIQIDFFTQVDDPLLIVSSMQQDLCSASHEERRPTISEQFTQNNFIFRFQSELIGLPTVHSASPHLNLSGELTLARSVESDKHYVAEFRLQVTSYYILGLALEQLNRINEAKEAYRGALKFPYARTWDPKGWFWSPAEAAAGR